ncbi:hypothetical protein PoB_000694600 [Plakobranchus ocellatus]|uniref:Uncharacterized protein n=1 Tax=Plakobranchus ocellatus TaxID=259542 RepID=A0AAV3YDG6_9GAST|nr:hypothetical protein PoB_000694600 [Plakobranchus ocellatus]
MLSESLAWSKHHMTRSKVLIVLVMQYFELTYGSTSLPVYGSATPWATALTGRLNYVSDLQGKFLPIVHTSVSGEGGRAIKTLSTASKVRGGKALSQAKSAPGTSMFENNNTATAVGEAVAISRTDNNIIINLIERLTTAIAVAMPAKVTVGLARITSKTAA